MITVYLVRHGQTEENLQRIFQGHLPGVLTEEGRQQAIDLCSQLAELPLDAVVSSDLQRVVDTVNLAFTGTEQSPDSNVNTAGGCMGTLQSLFDGRQIPWERTKLLREIDWGSWTGLAIASVDTSHIPADAENKQMLYERAGRFVDYLKTNYAGKKVLVVAHGLINRSIQAQLEGVGVDHLHEVSHMKNAEIRKFVLAFSA